MRTSAATGQGIDDLKRELERLCEQRHRPARFGAVPDGDRPVVHGGRARDGGDRDGRLGIGRRRRRPGVAARRQGRAGARPAPARPSRSSGSAAAPAAAINLVGVHHGEIGRGHELAAPGYLQATRVLSVEIVGGSTRPRGRSATGGGTASTWGRPRSRPRWPCSRATSWRRAARQLAQLFLAEPVVAVHGQPLRAPRGEPAGHAGRRPRAPAPGAPAPPPGSGGASPGWTGCDRPTRSSGWPPRLAFLGLKPWTERGLCALTGLPIDQVPPALDQLTASGALVEVPVGPRRSVRILAEFVADLEDRVLRALGRLHAARPRLSAIPRTHLAAELPDLGSDA